MESQIPTQPLDARLMVKCDLRQSATSVKGGNMVIKLNWQKQELEYLKTEFSSKKDSELSAELGKSENAIRIMASRLKIAKNSTTYRQNLVINEIENQVILGSLMGDLHCRITHTSKNARIEGGHSIIQKDYAQFKINLLNRFGWKVYLRNEAIFFQSRSFPSLNYYNNLFYHNGKMESAYF